MFSTLRWKTYWWKSFCKKSWKTNSFKMFSTESEQMFLFRYSFSANLIRQYIYIRHFRIVVFKLIGGRCVGNQNYLRLSRFEKIFITKMQCFVKVYWSPFPCIQSTRLIFNFFRKYTNNDVIDVLVDPYPYGRLNIGSAY